MRPVPGFKRNAAARIRDDHEKWTGKPVHGHMLEILGERREEIGTARVQMAYDHTAERLHSKTCERTWPWAFRATITKQKVCTGDPKERRECLKREEAKPKAWLSANR